MMSTRAWATTPRVASPPTSAMRPVVQSAGSEPDPDAAVPNSQM